MEGPCPCPPASFGAEQSTQSNRASGRIRLGVLAPAVHISPGPHITDIAVYLLKTLICTTEVLQEFPARGVQSCSQCGEVPPGSASAGHHGTRLFLSFLPPRSTWSLLVPLLPSFLLSSPVSCSAPQVSDPCSGMDVEALPGEGCVQLPWLRAQVQDLSPIPLARASFGQAGLSGLSGQIKITSVFAVTPAPVLPCLFSWLAPVGRVLEVREALQKFSRSKTLNCCRWKPHF